ncbi:MAG: hypothetical protein WCQ47_04660 [bacterium]
MIKLKRNNSLSLLFLVLLVLGFLSSCEFIRQDGGSGNGNESKSSSKEVVSFSIGDRVGLLSGSDITVTMPFGSDVTSLTPTIVISPEASISPTSGVAQDFTSPKIYTVTAEDLSKKDYTVTVNLAASDAKDITSFSFSEGTGVITGTEIEVTVPYGTVLTSLTPVIAITGTSVSPASGVAQNFTSPVTYTVTAADNTTKDYLVTVTPALPSDDATLSLSSTVKGQVLLGLGTPSAVLGSALSGTVTITSEKAADTSNAGNFITVFNKSNVGSVVKVVKYSDGASTSTFETDTAYANQSITTLDFFIIRVTAQDTSTVLYYKIVVTVTPPHVYVLRETGPAGGLIFYDKGSYSNGWRYLEAAPLSTQWTGKAWRSLLPNSNPNDTLIGTSLGVGTGQANTTAIVIALNSVPEVGGAAQLCDDLVLGSYSDWFLPSKDELHLIYTNLVLFSVGGFDTGANSYWSSSEDTVGLGAPMNIPAGRRAWREYFQTGLRSESPKASTMYVRAIRAF